MVNDRCNYTVLKLETAGEIAFENLLDLPCVIVSFFQLGMTASFSHTAV